MKRPLSPSPRRATGHMRGFTLVELLIGIVIIGVLASLAAVGYRKYIDGARISEPLATMQAIRGAQETLRRETGRYLDVSTSGTYYPINSNFGKTRSSWDFPAHTDYARWRLLEVAADGPMRFGYRTNAGRPGQAITTPIEYSPKPQLPSPPTDDWYIVQAKGDPDENGKPTILITASFSSEMLVNEDQL